MVIRWIEILDVRHVVVCKADISFPCSIAPVQKKSIAVVVLSCIGDIALEGATSCHDGDASCGIVHPVTSAAEIGMSIQVLPVDGKVCIRGVALLSRAGLTAPAADTLVGDEGNTMSSGKYGGG